MTELPKDCATTEDVANWECSAWEGQDLRWRIAKLCRRIRHDAERIAEMTAERDRLRTVVDACHEAVGENPASDDDTLADCVADLRKGLTEADALRRAAYGVTDGRECDLQDAIDAYRQARGGA